MAESVPDRIEKEIVIKAPRSRVWRAISTAEEFGSWFGVDLAGKSFAAGARVQGQITHPGYEHVTWDVLIERIEPGRLLAFRWHPYAIDTAVDYSHEPTTLVVFELHDVPEGTRLTVVESGFDRIPLARRAKAFHSNEGGWAQQVENIRRHVTAEA
jgi:uncharacterized protein YndB with AHSA1/START domain